MANWIEDADSRAMLGPGVSQQQSVLVFSASDYPTNGYPAPAAYFGLGRIRGMVPVAYQGNAEGYTWIYDNSTNPGTVRAFNGTAQVSASSNFAPGQIAFLANGY